GQPEQPETQSHVASPGPRHAADEPEAQGPAAPRQAGPGSGQTDESAFATAALVQSAFATAALVQVLAENGVEDVEDIARLLRAFGEGPGQASADKVTAVRVLFEHGVEAVEDVERV